MAGRPIIIERFSQGGPVPSFAAGARAHEPALRAVALRLCRAQGDAHDLVQDTLERGLRAGLLATEANVRAWLLSILRNRFVDDCRRHSRERAEAAAEGAGSLPGPAAPEPEPGWAKITASQLRAAVLQLPETFRLVYQLHALEGRSYAEISERLRVPKATVGTRLIRARRRLRDLLLPHLAAEGAR